MKLDRGFRFPCVTVKKIKIEVKSTSSPDQKVKAQNSFIHAGFQNHKGSNPTSEMSKISFSCGLDINAASVFTMLAAFYFFATCRRVYRKKRTVTEPIGGRLCEQAV